MKKMTDDDQLRQMLRAAFPPVQEDAPAHDLWRRIERRVEEPAPWSWLEVGLDVGLAAFAVLALAFVPGSFMLIAYHL